MRDSVLKRYPELTENDVIFVDLINEGGGVELSVWNSVKPKPTMEQIEQWVEEDAQLPPIKTPLDIVKEENESLKNQLQQVNNDLSDFMDFVINGGN